VSFLSLARGDQSARALLQRAIKARYGPRPVVLNSLRVTMTAQSKGLFGIPMRETVQMAFVDVTHWQRKATRKWLFLNRGSEVESYDGGAVYFGEGSNIQTTTEPLVVESVRRRLLATRAMLLTPLTQEGNTLKSLDNHTFQAYPDDAPGDAITIRLNPDDTVAAVECNRYNRLTQQRQLFVLRPAVELQTINDTVIPKTLTYLWGDNPPTTYQIEAVEVNPKIPLTEFTLRG